MIDLKELRRRVSGDPTYQGIHGPTWLNPREAVALLDMLDAAQQNAKRYAWLRIQPNDCSAPRIDICHWTSEEGGSVNNGEGLRGDAADAAIDAAMEAIEGGKA